MTKEETLKWQAAYQKKRRAELKAAGKCQDCGSRRPQKDRTLCKDCLLDRRDRQNTINLERKIQRLIST